MNVMTAFPQQIVKYAGMRHSDERRLNAKRQRYPEIACKMNRLITTILLAGLIMLISVVSPMGADAAEALRFRHAASLYADDQGLGLKQPQGVACLGPSVFVVADTANNRLLRFTLTKDAAKPEIVLWKPPAMAYPQRIRINPQGEIFVLDGKLRRVMRLSPEGKPLGFIGPMGAPLPEKITIRSFDIDSHGNVYFLDVLSKRVLACNTRGEVHRQIQFPEAYGFLSDLAVDRGGNIFLVDSINAQVFSARPGEPLFSPLSSKLKEFVRFPTSLALDPQGRIYLVDRNGSRIIALARDGTYIGKFSDLGWKEGLLNHPSQICLDEQGGLVVADTSNNRVQIFRPLK